MSLVLLLLLIAGAATSVNAGSSESGGEEFEPRIHGGRRTDPNSTAQSLVTIFDSFVFWCQGVIISDYWVLTVANCLISLFPETTYVVVGLGQTTYPGADKWKSWSDGVSIAGSPVRLFHTHPKFTGKFEEGYQYDIALILLKDSMKDKYEYRAALHASWTVESIPVPDQKCSITGWAHKYMTDDGRDEGDFGPLMLSTIPWTAPDINMVDQSKCVKAFPPKMRGAWGGKDGLQLCSVGTHGGTDPLLGDAGIPLICGDSVAGLVSFSNMGWSTTPEGTIRYTRVAAYWDFFRMYAPDAIEYDPDNVDDYDSVIDDFEELDTLKVKPKKCKSKG